MSHVIQEVKKFKSLRELILVPFEERVACNVSARDGSTIMREEVILSSDPVEKWLLGNEKRQVPWLYQDLAERIAFQRDALLSIFLSETRNWKMAFQNAEAESNDGWKAPEIKFKIARRGIADTP